MRDWLHNFKPRKIAWPVVAPPAEVEIGQQRSAKHLEKRAPRRFGMMMTVRLMEAQTLASRSAKLVLAFKNPST